MNKHLFSAFLTVSLISLNIMPVEARSEFLTVDETQIEEYTSGQWCVWVPWIGGLCWDL